MNYSLKTIYLFFFLLILMGCKEDASKKTNSNKKQEKTTEQEQTSVNEVKILKKQPDSMKAPQDMAWIPGGKFMQGAVRNDTLAFKQEKPSHPVGVDGFFMDKHEVTNAQFRKFVKETGYKTVAERPVDWEEMKKQVPPGTPKPADSLLQPGSLIFKKTKSSVPNLYDYSQWWEWKIGANWKHPKGPETSIEGKDDYPVVQVSYEDAQAYCKWAGRRLPTEAEWEHAARAGQEEARFTWGNDFSTLAENANTWEGEFPTKNTKKDGFESMAPIKSYPPNPYGLYDMAGNVWEITSDWYNMNYYQQMADQGFVMNPKGADKPYNPNNPNLEEKVIKGGSFLCNISYCASFRISGRMGTSTDSAQEHVGFRTVATVAMLQEEQK